MKWLSIDTDIFEDGKIKTLIRNCGVEGYGIYQYLLTKIAKKIDIDNSRNGYFELDDSDDPAEALAWELHLEEDKVKQTLEQLSELELIDPESFEENQIYIPKIMERKHTKAFLRKQEGGRKGGSKKDKGNKKDSESSPSRTPKSSPTTNKDKDKDSNKGTTTNKGESASQDSLKAVKTDSSRYDYPDEFEEVWDAYPKNNGNKKACHEKWKARRRDGVEQEKLLEAARNYAKMVKATDTAKKYRKHGKTFFGPKNHWADFLDEKFDLSDYGGNGHKSQFDGQDMESYVESL